MTLKDKKHWSSQSEAARDEVRDAFAETVEWLMLRRRQVAWTAGGAAGLALLAALFLYNRRVRVDEAWDKLSRAEIYAYSGRPDEARKLIEEIASDGASPAAAAMARLLDGDLAYPRGDYEQALAAYDKAVETAPESLRPFALAQKAMTLEAAGRAADGAAAAQAFLDAHSDHLLAPQVHAVLARCQAAQGQADAAKATLQRIALQYPNTPWAAWATSRLQPPAK